MNAKTRKMLSLEKVLAEIARYFDVKPEAIRERNSRKSICHIRKVFFHVARRLPANYSFEELGIFLNYRDHTTALFGSRSIETRIAAGDAELKKQVEILIENLNAPATKAAEDKQTNAA